MLNASPVSTTAGRTPCQTAALQQHRLAACRAWRVPAQLRQGRPVRPGSSRHACAAAQRHSGGQAPASKLQPPTAVATNAAAPTAEPPASQQLLEEPSAPSLTAAAAAGGEQTLSREDASSLLASVAEASTASQPRLSRRPSLQDIQAATSEQLAQLQVVVAESGAASSTQQLSEVLHQLEVLEHNLSEALQQHQEEEQAAAAAAAAVTTTAPAPPAAPHVPSEADAYVVVDDPLASLAGSQLPLAGAFDPQLKAGATTMPSVSVMAGALTATSAAAAGAAAPTAAAAAAAASIAAEAAVAAAAAALELPTQQHGAPHVSPALEAAALAEMEAAAEAVTMGATGDWEESDVMAAAAAGAASSTDTTPITTVSGTAPADNAIDSTKLWALFVLGLSYVHQATTGFALPALLPMISPSLHLDDFQGALLTSGYSYLYAAALVPVGLLADRVKRPQLLAVGLVLWSSLSIVASGARSFSDLLITRIGFAAAQATQNPVSFSLIPDLFPANKSTALAGYNCAIYLGRALSFASVLAAHRLADSAAAAAGGLEGAVPNADIGLSMVPLDRLDLQRMSILYTTGDMAAVTPVYNYNFNVIAYEGAAALGGSEGWRELLTYIGYPGFVIAALMMLSVREPRDDKQQEQQALASHSTSSSSTASLATISSSASSMEEEVSVGALATRRGGSSNTALAATGRLEAWRQGATNLSQTLPLDVVNRLLRQGAIVARRTAAAFRNATNGSSSSSETALAAPGSAPQASVSSVHKLIRMPAFQTTTFAAALNDVGSYALIAWHSTFYERVYHLDSSVYAPMLAIILPVGGILGGLGGGLIGDYLSVVGGRQWLTAGASVMAAPFITQSLLAENSSSSFLALLVGFALSEAWRAPSAIMIRNIAPQELGSTASAMYLCIRNVVGGLGPVAVAKLAEVVGLQHAMLLAPSCYVMSGLLFLLAEKEIEEQTRKERELLGLPAPQQGVPAPVPEASN